MERYLNRKILYAYDLAVVADNKEDLQKTLQEWSNTFKKTWPPNESGEDRSNVDRRTGGGSTCNC